MNLLNWILEAELHLGVFGAQGILACAGPVCAGGGEWVAGVRSQPHVTATQSGGTLGVYAALSTGLPKAQDLGQSPQFAPPPNDSSDWSIMQGYSKKKY